MLRQVDRFARSKRAAFSLAELVISIGILILMMALAGQVFSITIKSTGQATALTEVTQQLRILEETLREDLRNVQPGQSVMLIQGNPINAFWTQLGKDAAFDETDPSKGYGHVRDLEREKLDADGKPMIQNGYEVMQEPRADILMFFTARKATSAIDPKISARVQQVVYGHAEIGEYDPDPSVTSMLTTAFPILNTDPFQIPAQQWHLARRSILLIPTSLDSESSWETVMGPATAPTGGGLGNGNLLVGQRDYISGFRYDDLVIKPFDSKNSWDSIEPWYLPAVFGNTANLTQAQWHKPYSRCKLDPTPPMMMANRMGAYFLPNCASFKVEWSLDPRGAFVNGRLDGSSEIFWLDPGDSGDDERKTYKLDDPLYSIQKQIDELENKSDAPSKNLKAQLESLLCEPTLHADGDRYSLADRFRGVSCPGFADSDYPPWEQLSPDKKRPNIALFTATRPSNKCSQSPDRCFVDADCPQVPGPGGTLIDQTCVRGFIPDDIWPGALRITVDLYDREGRLERPIRHVMVIPVGR